MLKAAETRLPNLTSAMEEDQIHHNYWLLQNRSVLGDYTIWQLQPLLEFALRLYFWFPVLSLPAGVWVALIAIAILLIAARLWTYLPQETSQKPGIQQRAFSAAMLLNGLGWLASFVALLFTLHGSANPLLANYSVSSVFALLVTLSVAIALIITTFTPLRLNAYKQLMIGDQDAFLGRLILLSATFVFVSTLIAFQANEWFNFGPTLNAYLWRLYPMLAAIAISIGTVLWFTLAQRQQKAWNLPRLIFIGFVSILFLVYIQPFGNHNNYTELILKTPSLFCSLGAIVLVFYLSLLSWRSWNYPTVFGLVFAFLVTTWLVLHPTDIKLAGFARNYTFVSLISILWFWFYFFRKDESPQRFWLVSFFFLNAHYFAIPIVLGAYGLDALNEFLRKDRRLAWRNLWQGGLAVGLVLLINSPVSYYILTIGSDFQVRSLSDVVAKGIELLGKYFHYTNFPLFNSSIEENVFQSILFAALILALMVASKRQIAWKIGAFSFLIIPISLLYYAAKSNYVFHQRYFSVFLGFGFIVVLLAWEKVIHVLNEPRKQLFQTGIFSAAAILAIVSSLPIFFNYFLADLNMLHIPDANGSNYYKVYTQLKAKRASLQIFLNTPIAIRYDIPLFYLDFVDGGTRTYYELQGASLAPAAAETAIATFLDSHPGGIIVFDWLEGSQCPQVDQAMHLPLLVETIQSGEACLWLLSNAKTYEEVCEVARVANFPPSADTRMCTDE
jgi:hypothetical protein